MVIVVDSISFQSPIAQLPVSGSRAVIPSGRQDLNEEELVEVGLLQDTEDELGVGFDRLFQRVGCLLVREVAEAHLVDPSELVADLEARRSGGTVGKDARDENAVVVLSVRVGAFAAGDANAQAGPLLPLYPDAQLHELFHLLVAEVRWYVDGRGL